MVSLKKDFKYKVVPNFLNELELKYLQYYCDYKHISNTKKFDFIQNNNGDTFFYGDPFIETVLLFKLPLMEKETNLKLNPNYSFWRMYTKGAVLAPHKDRPSCEVSVTVQINGDVDWPIYMDGKPIVLKNGDGVIYLGNELEHGRKPLEGDFQAQAFLHYTDQNGPFKNLRFDNRMCLGYVQPEL